MVIESIIPFRLGGTRAETIDRIPGVLGLKAAPLVPKMSIRAA